MEGKLIKLGLSEGYRLDDLNGNYIASTLNGKNKLSLKNCEAIENGYDLMKLAEENSHKYYDVKTTDWHCNYNGFFSGFQKALEILGDKKFMLSEEDLHKVIDMARLQGEQSFLMKHSNEEIIQSLQQTEWDVEIEMEEKWIAGTSTYGHGEYELKPKLDADGCLILRRI